MSDLEQYRPHPGPQEAAHCSPADEGLFGGQAGGGKSVFMVTEAARYIAHKNYSSIIFRQTHPQLHEEKGPIWLARKHLRYLRDAQFREKPILGWKLPESSYRFGAMPHLRDYHKYDGTSYPFIGFDELSGFHRVQYTSMFARNRRMKGDDFPCRIWATANPPNEWEPGYEWILERWEPWLNPSHPEKAFPGELRYYINEGDKEIRVDRHYKSNKKWSRTFIPSTRFDNPSLDLDHYEKAIGALDLIQRMRLGSGDWMIKAGSGKVLNKNWFKVVDRFPEGVELCRFWDTAATAKDVKTPAGSGPAFTASCLGARHKGITYFQLMQQQVSAGEVPKWIRRTVASEKNVRLGVEQEPGSQSKIWLTEFLSELRHDFGITADKYKVLKDKVQRAMRWAPEAEEGKIVIVENPLLPSKVVLNQVHGFPDLPFKDLVDAMSGCWTMIVEGAEIVGTDYAM